MILKDTATFYTISGTSTTSEGKIRQNAPTKYLEGIKCNIQFDDGHLSFEKYGVTGSNNNDAFLYVRDKRAYAVKRADLILVDEVRYKVEKVIPYSTHLELILNEAIN
jgi:hypothetical protein